MKKTYNINLNNQIFYIDENAYIQLQNYIEALEKHYLKEEDGKEILTDIESRIAELFKEFLEKSHHEVISQTEIDQVIEIMGTPDAIIDEDTEHHAPKENNYRKLYRDPDKAILGGVAAGVANYFSIPIMWIRLIFILCGIFYGISIIIYIILWIVLPPAKTAKQKLEMKGQKINVSNIEKNIRDTYNEVKTNSKLKNVTAYINRKLNAFFSACKTIFHKSLSFCLSILSVVGILAGIVFFISACWGIFFSYHFAPENYYTFFRYAWAPVPLWLIKLILLFITGIPAFLLIYYSVRYLFKLQKRKGIFLIFTGIWIIICMSAIIIGIYQARNYAQEYQSKTDITLLPGNPQNHSLYVTFKSPANLQYTSIFQGPLDHYLLHCPEKQETDSTSLYLKPQITLAKTDLDHPELIILKKARGFSGAEAIENTEDMLFKYEWRNDTLHMDDYYQLSCNRWRVNELHIKILIPENYQITLNNPPRNNIRYRSIFQNPNKFYYKTSATQTYIMKKGKLTEVN